MGKQDTTGLSKRQRQRQEQLRIARRKLRTANPIVSALLFLTWALVLLALGGS